MAIASHPYIYTRTDADQEQLDPEEVARIQEEEIKGTALSTKDWRQAQSQDRNLRFVVNCLLEIYKPTTEDEKTKA